MPVIAWMLVIFAGSTDILSAEHTSRFLVPFLRWLDQTMSFDMITKIHTTLRKIGHFTEYAILAALMWRALSGTVAGMTARKLATGAFLVAAAFAASDEFHQSFIPTRSSSFHDVMIDCCGALFVVLLCSLFSRGRTMQETR